MQKGEETNLRAQVMVDARLNIQFEEEVRVEMIESFSRIQYEIAENGNEKSSGTIPMGHKPCLWPIIDFLEPFKLSQNKAHSAS